MNERIQELMAQADMKAPGGKWKEYFAELLITECCKVINAAKPGVVQVPAEVALDLTAKNVKAYFGVK